MKEKSIHVETRLRPEWSSFIDVYIANGFNATKAYLSVYKNVSPRTASSNAYRLLTNADIRKEIDARLQAQSITRDWVLANLKRLVDQRDDYTAVKALEILARILGMIKPGEHGSDFFQQNIAVFQPIVTAAEKEEYEKMIAKSGRVIE